MTATVAVPKSGKRIGMFVANLLLALVCGVVLGAIGYFLVGAILPRFAFNMGLVAFAVGACPVLFFVHLVDHFKPATPPAEPVPVPVDSTTDPGDLSPA